MVIAKLCIGFAEHIFSSDSLQKVATVVAGRMNVSLVNTQTVTGLGLAA
jgi:hypothetical protein